MRTASVVLGIAIALILAGCLSPPDESALTAGAAARDTGWIASAVDVGEGVTLATEDLRLITVIGIEAANDTAVDFPARDAYLTERLESMMDGTPGDGRAPLWLHVYHAADVGKWVVVHRDAAGRGATTTDTLQAISGYLAQFQSGKPLAEGWIDSNEAARTAALDAAWAEATTTGGSILMVLHQPPHRETPVWGFRHAAPGAGATATFVLDAADGKALTAADAYDFAPAAENSQTVLLTPTGNTDVTLNVPAAHKGLALRITPTQVANPAAHVHAWLYGPDGEQESLDDTTWGSGEIVGRVPSAKPGEHTLTIGSLAEMDAANSIDEVLVTWCTDGARLDPLGLAPEPASCLA